MPKQIVAIACSDLHLTLNPPLARAKEPDWLFAQARQLTQLHQLAIKHNVPILCAGDIFDRWNCPVALTNWALDHLPPMIAIPGQHDLPYHQLEAIQNSSYWNLVKHGLIQNLIPGKALWEKEKLMIQGFPWGTELTPCPFESAGKIHIALVHKYIWIDGHSYSTASEDSKVTKGIWDALKGWDIVIFGDNHKGFQITKGKQTIFNCGGFQRRKSDEIDYQPQIGLIFSDGSMEPFLLNCSEDVIETTSKKEQIREEIDLGAFLNELGELKSTSIDFLEIIGHMMQDKNERVQKLIIEALETK